MASKLRATLLIAALVAGTTAGAAEAAKKHTPKPISTKFYLNGNAPAGKCTESPSLSTKLDSSGSEGCGLEGLPLDEVFYQAGSPNTTTYATTKHDGMPMVADTKRKITGQVGTSSWTGQVGGLGTVVVDLEVDAITSTGQSVVISTQTLKANVTPAGPAAENLPWSAAWPASLAGKTLVSFSVSTTIHGDYINQGAKHYQGDSFVIVPGLK
ncbi:MAG: hypothetical protein JO079_09285 [Frankiaceae bacterium]|nr:hypothetical protein [Frankiaceae bacterium]MBV9368339.1 hypothetical protein [Frankiales bacterium]